MARSRRSFSKEFRDNAVRLVIEGGRSCAAVGREHDLACSQVAAWVRQARYEAGSRSKADPSHQGETVTAELERLRRENLDQANELQFVKKTLVYLASLKK